MKYSEKNASQISFPLGGIGTGSIGLAGNGSLRDIEIKNRPNKNSTAEFTHFAIKAEDENGLIDTRIVQGDLTRDFAGSMDRPRSTGFGFGQDRGTMAGFPHFEKVEFDGEFPVAHLTFEHQKFPGNLEMSAFNPLIPTNEDDSSIPAAFFTFSLKNTADKKLHYTLAFSCNNFYCKTKTNHIYEENNGTKLIFLSNDLPKDTTEYGDLTIATDCEEVSYQQYWFRGSWFDNSTVFWQEFAKAGKIANRVYKDYRNIPVYNDVSDDVSDIATLAAHVTLEPQEAKEIRFILSWSNPYMSNHWQIMQAGLSEEEIARRRAIKWKNYYARLFENSRASALYAMNHFDRLYKETMLYHDAMFQSSLPDCVKDAVTANISVLKSPTCLRLEDGSFYGFEGLRAHMGSCEGTCTHVWSYTYAMAFLFPKLERSARTNEYTYSMQPNGGMGFRLQLPLGAGATSHRPAADGQFGTLLRVYREFLVSGDKEWLSSIWPEVKRSLEFAWSKDNNDLWDPEQAGILIGCQHHTLDMELFGANSWLSGMYLAALKAASYLADIMDEKETSKLYMEIFERGQKTLNQELYNGEYYHQNIDLQDKSILEKYSSGVSLYIADPVAGYWNEENQEMKYQICEGCSIDQVLGQWHADLLNLGNIFDADKTKSALSSIYRYNFISDMRDHVNPCRVFGMNDEQGTMICSYPEGRMKPLIPVPYCEETMHGFEYQAASHMIKYGLEDQGLACVKAVRDRYDGYKRNPWNEIECGSNYARSMSSYALLLFYSGFSFNMHEKKIGFRPLHNEEYKFFWSLDSGFGTIEKKDNKITLNVLYGSLELNELQIETEKIKNLEHQNQELSFQVNTDSINFDHTICISAGENLQLTYC